MWLLRCARKNRWEDRHADDPSHVAEAAKDLSLRPGPYLSGLHREAKGMTEAIGRILAANILRNRRFQINRIKKKDIEEATRQVSSRYPTNPP